MPSLITRLIAFFILILSSPLLLVIAVIIRLGTDGPVIFRQKRVGRDKKSFYLYKFRTMVKGAEKMQHKYRHLNEADGPVFKIQNDPRYTGFGKILSRTGLDELPQLVNIIKGEMSFVGPRPLPVNEVKKIPKKYDARFLQLPGITSSWVIKGAHSLSFEQWMRLDLEDVRRKSLKYDFAVVLSTIKMIMGILLRYEK